MPRFTFVVLTCALRGRETEFQRWYDEQHLPDVKRVPGIVSAKRFRIPHQEVKVEPAPTYSVLAIYEMVADDPLEIIAEIKRRAGTDAMPMTDSYDRAGAVQIIGELVSEA